VPRDFESRSGERGPFDETRASRPYLRGRTPRLLSVLILSRDPKVIASNWPVSVAKSNAVAWERMQEEAKGLSSVSRRIIAKGSGHYIQDDRPDLVNRQIASFILMIRNRRSFADNHSTIEE
jgi:hypothetical protein